MDYILFLAGVAVTLIGADWLVDGASGLAKRFGVSEFAIGVVIVGLGTSMPELTVSTMGALRGSASIAIGNVTGSNLFNTLLILGVTALISPIAYSAKERRKDMGFNIGASLVLLVFALDAFIFHSAQGILSRAEGIGMLLLFALYIFITFKNDEIEPSSSAEIGDAKAQGVLRLGLTVLAGIALLVVGGHLFVERGCNIARQWHVSESVIAMTLMAGGTSLPELATCIVAALKKQDALALGNILGSNIANILLILGCCATITPLGVSPIDLESIAVLPVVGILLWITAFIPKRLQLGRAEGALFVLIYAAYITYAILH